MRTVRADGWDRRPERRKSGSPGVAGVVCTCSPKAGRAVTVERGRNFSDRAAPWRTGPCSMPEPVVRRMAAIP